MKRAPLDRGRRCALAALALAGAALLLRPQVAGALVVRGDDLLARNARAEALVHYRRALLLDPASSLAADRYVFVALQGRRPADIAAGIAIANAYLARNPHDGTLLADRAMCYLIARHFRRAALMGATR